MFRKTSIDITVKITNKITYTNNLMLSLTIQFAYLIHVLKRQKDILHRQSIYARKDQQIKKIGMIIKTAEWHVFSKQFSRLFYNEYKT